MKPHHWTCRCPEITGEPCPVADVLTVQMPHRWYVLGSSFLVAKACYERMVSQGRPREISTPRPMEGSLDALAGAWECAPVGPEARIAELEEQLRAAVAAERERCAAIAADIAEIWLANAMDQTYPASDRSLFRDRSVLAQVILRRIREDEPPDTPQSRQDGPHAPEAPTQAESATAPQPDPQPSLSGEREPR